MGYDHFWYPIGLIGLCNTSGQSRTQYKVVLKTNTKVLDR